MSNTRFSAGLKRITASRATSTQSRAQRSQKKSERFQQQRLAISQRRAKQEQRYLNAFRRAGSAFRVWWLMLLGLIRFCVSTIRHSPACRSGEGSFVATFPNLLSQRNDSVVRGTSGKERKRRRLSTGMSLLTCAVEKVEVRSLLSGTNVSSTSPVLIDGVEPFSELDLEFSGPLTGQQQGSHYSLKNAGADGFLGTTDDLSIPLTTSTFPGDGITLNFDTLSQGAYRLTVSDSLQSNAGRAIDGDGNGHDGGSFVRDFTV